MDPLDLEISAEVKKEFSPFEFLVDENTFVEPSSFKKLLAEAPVPPKALAGDKVSPKSRSYQENEIHLLARGHFIK